MIQFWNLIENSVKGTEFKSEIERFREIQLEISDYQSWPRTKRAQNMVP